MSVTLISIEIYSNNDFYYCLRYYMQRYGYEFNANIMHYLNGKQN